MIAPNSLAVSSPERSLLLAPFTERHLQAVLPISRAIIGYLPRWMDRYLTTSDPEAYIQYEQSATDHLTWGIFEPGYDSDPRSPQSFIGTVLLHDVGCGVLQVSTSLYRRDAQGKGLGTLAKMGVIDRAFKSKARSVDSLSAQGNTPAHQSLRKAGLVQVSAGGGVCELINGSVQQITEWTLLHPLVQLHDSKHHELLRAGRKTYLDAHARLAIQQHE